MVRLGLGLFICVHKLYNKKAFPSYLLVPLTRRLYKRVTS